MKIRIIYPHSIFSSVARLEKGDIVELPEDEADLYISRDWAVPSDDEVTVNKEIEKPDELEDDLEFEDDPEKDEEG